MIIHQYYLECLSQASYLVADEHTREAVLIDPRRDIDEYLKDISHQGLTLIGVINTHVHADFVAGNLELAACTGAWIGLSEHVDIGYETRPLQDGDRISLGNTTLTIVYTPGHTLDSICILAAPEPDAQPEAVFTGDTLFIGDVGRPDLTAQSASDPGKMALLLHDSLGKLVQLDDEVVVYPGHGAGSSCGKNLSADLQSTIGREKEFNSALQPMPQEQFVAMITTDQPIAPDYFFVNAAMNKSDRKIMGNQLMNTMLSAESIQAVIGSSMLMIDTRAPDEFAYCHIRGSVNIGIDGRFAETAGMLVNFSEPVVLLSAPGREAEAVTRLARIGFDRVMGVFLFTPEWEKSFFPEDLRRAIRYNPGDIALLQESVIVDVRNPGEIHEGKIPGALHIPLAQLRERMHEIPSDKQIIVYCAGGWRSSVAASQLRKNGFANTGDILGGFNGWKTFSQKDSNGLESSLPMEIAQ